MPRPIFQYRRDIDGLRAISILPVVLYHAEIPGFSGGYVGVDVFFVISGFLITSIIIKDLDRDKFSLVQFWERRVRRIIPALFTVIFATIVVSHFFLLWPDDYKSFGASAAAQSLFIANMYFLRTRDYFAAAPDTMPLLHVWSLSVEEQFYLFYPLVLLACMVFARRWITTIVACLVALSFAYNLWLVEFSPGGEFGIPFLPNVWNSADNATAAFYLLPTRAWELGLGAILALTTISIQSRRLAEILGLTGLAAIVLSTVIYNDETAFPGMAALLPTFGAAAVISAGQSQQTFVSRILSAQTLVWLGLISYSLYLWHWPIFVIARQTSIDPLTQPQMLLLAAFSIFVAWLSYTVIEKPVRKRVVLANRKGLFAAAGVAAMAIAVLGVSIRIYDRSYDRLPSDAVRILEATKSENPRREDCFRRNVRQLTQAGPCILGNPDDVGPARFVLWGDSHSNAVFPVFDQMARERNVKGAYFGSPACVPVPNVWRENRPVRCSVISSNAMAYIRQNDVRIVVLVGRWSVNVIGRQDGNMTSLITDADEEAITLSSARAVFERNLSRLIDDFGREGRVVYIMKQVPMHFGYDARREFRRAVLNDDDQLSGVIGTVEINDHLEYHAVVNTILERLSVKENVVLIDPAPALCDSDGVCRISTGEDMLYRDESHLTISGAMRLRSVLDPVFDAIAN